MTKEVASELELIHTTVIQIHRTLETLQRPMGGCEDFLIFLTVEKLDPDTVKAWDYKLDLEQACEDHFLSTHLRDETGRYVVRLPFKGSPEELGNSKIKAERMMRSLASKFEKDSNHAALYRKFMHEYKQLNHMERISDSTPEPSSAYYLPHHGVLREQSLTTKLRVVFNGSCPTSNGISLNDLLHTGAKLQTDLFDVLLWFRFYLYAFTADIEKMFRQIKVNSADWDYQRIFWLDELALRALVQLVLDEGQRFPLAKSIMEKGRYVDEFHGGANSRIKAKQRVAQLDALLMAGGFILKKWVSNNPAILEDIPPDRKITFLQNDQDKLVNVLGLTWDINTDTFHVSLEPSIVGSITKRTVLSAVARFFDPLGFLSPITVAGKIFIQELWLSKLDWDEDLPDNLAKKWITFTNQLKDMPKFEIPRWIGLKSDAQIEIYGFSDASQKAMAAVVFLRSVFINGEIRISFIASKTKVAPMKKLTIPRLELNAAVLLVKLVCHLLKVMNLKQVFIFLGIDSEVAKKWIEGHPSKWKDFVQNRVSLIQQALPQAIWRFVPGNENPADLATRGLTPLQLSESKEWWQGPQWLSLNPVMWPEESHTISPDENMEERIRLVSTVLTSEVPQLWDLLFKFSNLTKLLRITALCRKFIFKLKGIKKLELTTFLTVSEIEAERRFWVKSIQNASFSSEIKVLQKGQSLPKSNSLAILTPYLDSDGLLRVGGRLQHSQLPDNSKHPLILPKTSAFTTLVIADAHSRTLHGGTQITLSFIRQNYWIVGGRQAVKSFILKCVKCARYRQQRAQQLMGQLPTIHLEFVTAYTSDAFIAAFRRFTARR
ncbi:uncharacterized protein, partial [Temnothorax nylanderi]|uniref:uncharacterized protein n=1 Tax=Temnothorax nylanderi TaxID=102681 RepID=UPI003A885AE7